MTTAADIETQAATWLVKRDGGVLSDAEQVEYDAWMDADPRHRATYKRLETAWRQADNLRRLRPLNGEVDVDLLLRSPFAPPPIDEYPASEETRATPAPPAVDDTPTETPKEETPQVDDTERPRRRRWIVSLSIAATLAVLGVGVLLWYTHGKADWRTYTTDFGGLSRIVLDDGSVISLNTQSEIRVRLTPELRQVVLERGEALFKVAHERHRPFDVAADGTTVRAVGTEFSVRVREPSEARDGVKDVEVLVKEGRVAIDREHASSQSGSTATVSAGEAVVISGQRVEVQKVAETDVDRKLAWTEGRLWFERQRLKDVVAEFNRYNRRQMVIADPAIEDLRIGGGFEATDPESFIAALERTLGVRAIPVLAADGSHDEAIRLIGMRDGTH